METDNPRLKKNIVIAIAGFAGAGKDTLADSIIDSCVHHQLDVWISKAKFADSLKSALNRAFGELGLGVDAFTEDREIKKGMRNCMVELGKYARSLDVNIFARLVAEDMETCDECFPSNDGAKNRYITIISDMRYKNEYSVMLDYCAKNDWIFIPIYIERDGFGPANSEEENSIKELIDKSSGRFIDSNSFIVKFKTGDFKSITDFGIYIVKNFIE